MWLWSAIVTVCCPNRLSSQAAVHSSNVLCSSCATPKFHCQYIIHELEYKIISALGARVELSCCKRKHAHQQKQQHRETPYVTQSAFDLYFSPYGWKREDGAVAGATLVSLLRRAKPHIWIPPLKKPRQHKCTHTRGWGRTHVKSKQWNPTPL